MAVALVALAGCPGSNAGLGESCGGNSDCNSALQCLEHRCAERCINAPDCGDGYACDKDGLCHPAEGIAGDRCKSEVDCAPGLSCQIDGTERDDAGVLRTSCIAEKSGRPAGDACSADADCRHGTCELGHCLDLCADARDCPRGNACQVIPRATETGGTFVGCLPIQGTVTWPVPALGPSVDVRLPVPANARSVELVMSVDDPTQKVGAAAIFSPTGARLYNAPCTPPQCPADTAVDQYFSNPIRHLPALGQSVLMLPSTQSTELAVGAYRVQVASFHPSGFPGTAIPKITAVVRLDSRDPTTVRTLGLRFHFLNLADHPCAALSDDKTFADLGNSVAFRGAFTAVLRTVLFHAGINIAIDNTNDVILDRPDLDRLDLANVGALLQRTRVAEGIDVFFVRSLSPAGLMAYAPNPGPAGVAGTRQSGIVISMDALCYRDWQGVARLTAHEIARYMGLYHTVELGHDRHPTWRDPLDDGDNGLTSNLLYFSELSGVDATPSGTELTPQQADILRRSAALR